MVYRIELALYFVKVLAVIDRNFSSCFTQINNGILKSTKNEARIGPNFQRCKGWLQMKL